MKDSKEALKELTLMINREKHINSEWNKKIYDLELIIKKDLDRLEKLEKENQELKEKMEIKEEANKFLLNQNLWVYEENTKLKKAIEILNDKLDIKLEVYHNGGCTLNYKVIRNCILPNDRCLKYLEVEEYKSLREVFKYE